LFCFVGAAAAPYEICSQEADWSGLGDQSDLDYYCNKPHLPVSGSEGSLYYLLASLVVFAV